MEQEDRWTGAFSAEVGSDVGERESHRPENSLYWLNVCPRPARTSFPEPVFLQIAELAGDRLLVRGPAGVSMLGLAREDIERALAITAAGRPAGDELSGALSSEVEPRDVLDLMRRLTGRGPVLETGASEIPAPASGRSGFDSRRVLLLGGGALAGRLAESIGIAASPVEDLDARLRGSDLVVCVLEQAPYERVFEIQRACLRAGVSSLFVTIDADGTRIGPAVVPGIGPCIACAQIASFRVLELPGPDLIAAIAGFRTGEIRREDLETVARGTAREATALLDPRRRPAHLTSVRLLRATGTLEYAVTPAHDCPLCASFQGTSADRPHASTALRQLVDRHRRSPRLAVAAAGVPGTSIGIAGGGTAGYLTALALRRKHPDVEVTLIESSAIPVIGVGEATTPLMPQFLHVDLGLDVGELFREVAPTFKLGIRFEWGSDGAFNYPFGPVHVLEPAVYDGNIRRCSPRSLLIEAAALPAARGAGDPLGDLGVDVAYHLDNRRFVEYLRRQAGRAGVRTVDARIDGVEVDGDGESVTALIAGDGQRFRLRSLRRLYRISLVAAGEKPWAHRSSPTAAACLPIARWRPACPITATSCPTPWPRR